MRVAAHAAVRIHIRVYTRAWPRGWPRVHYAHAGGRTHKGGCKKKRTKPKNVPKCRKPR
jgi:hypothetical protein